MWSLYFKRMPDLDAAANNNGLWNKIDVLTLDEYSEILM